MLSANEIAAAKLVQWSEFNPQSQLKRVWPAAFLVVRSYPDQLVRNEGLSSARTAAIATALDAAEKQRGAARRASLTALARAVSADSGSAKDGARVTAMAGAIRELAGASR